MPTTSGWLAKWHRLRWNGSSWAAQQTGTTVQLMSIWGIDANNVWAVGSGGTGSDGEWNGVVFGGIRHGGKP